MKQRNPILVLAVAALVAIAIVAYLRHNRSEKKPAEVAVQGGSTLSKVQPPAQGVPTTNAAPAVADTNVVYQLRVGQVLATVNGVEIKLGDLVPLTTTNADASMPLDAVTYNYLLDRAIVRELMMQTAKAQGVGLTDSQQQQLAKLQAERGQPEPGLLAKLNVNEADIELEMRDALAFMYQTSLMARQGYSPDVTPDQVDKYYKAHASQFGEPPSDADERKAWWQNVDITIRNQMAKQARVEFIAQLQAYLDELKAKAKITRTTPSS